MTEVVWLLIAYAVSQLVLLGTFLWIVVGLQREHHAAIDEIAADIHARQKHPVHVHGPVR